MAVPGSKAVILGFMSVCEAERSGLRGGYLLTTDYGRPVEFHYTSEVRVPQTQRILHGANLDQYLYAEAIAKPMTDRQGKAPKIVLVNRIQLLELRTLIPAPVVYLEAEAGPPVLAPLTVEATESGEAQTQAAEATETEEENVTAVKPICHADYPQDLAAFDKIKDLVPKSLDWLEPFERIERALAEVRDPDTRLTA